LFLENKRKSFDKKSGGVISFFFDLTGRYVASGWTEFRLPETISVLHNKLDALIYLSLFDKVNGLFTLTLYIHVQRSA
jgi:hypothetical protein